MIVKNLKEWHKTVCERDGFICCGCGKDYSDEYYFQEDGNGRVNQYVFGHHVKTQKAFPKLVLETDNGRCVDKDCHTRIHKGLIKLDGNETVDMSTGEILESAPSVDSRIRGNDRMCKCKKYIAMAVSGVCLSCEKRDLSSSKGRVSS
jgi:hypothetical protein